MILPETAGQKLLVDHGRVAGVRTGDKGRGKDGEPLANFEPGVDVTARITVLAEGTAGHLTTAAIDHFGLHGRNPQIWALGVKEVWKVPKPLRRIVHTMGWPLRKRARYGEFGGSWIYPMGDEHVSLGFVVGLEYADVELSAHDLLQEFKTHRLVRKILAGGERVAWGAKTITEGGLHLDPVEAQRAGAAARRRGRRARQRAAAQGRALRDRVGPARRRGGVRGAAARRGRGPERRARRLRRRPPLELRLEGPHRGPEHAPGLRQGLLHGRRARERHDRDEGEAPAEGLRDAPERGDAAPADRARDPLSGAGRLVHVRQALLRLRLGQQDARRPAESHPRRDERPARRGGDVALDVPGAGLRGGGGGRRTAPSSCSSTRRTACSAARSAPRAAG